MKSLHYLYILLLGLFFFTSCAAQQEPISYGKDNCHHCKMTISDNRYGSEMVTKKGKVFKFDSIECMAKYLNEKGDADTGLLLVTDYTNPGTFVETSKASFLQSEQLPSPMGMNLTAFNSEEEAKNLAGEKGGEVVNWEGVKQICKDHGHAKH
jgi:copper chaperone NosL